MPNVLYSLQFERYHHHPKLVMVPSAFPPLLPRLFTPCLFRDILGVTSSQVNWGKQNCRDDAQASPRHTIPIYPLRFNWMQGFFVQAPCWFVTFYKSCIVAHVILVRLNFLTFRDHRSPPLCGPVFTIIFQYCLFSVMSAVSLYLLTHIFSVVVDPSPSRPPPSSLPRYDVHVHYFS